MSAKETIHAARTRAVGVLQRVDWLPALLARVALGLVFLIAGWGKLQHLGKVTRTT